MAFKTLEEQYYFIKPDYRYEDEEGHVQYPVVDIGENVELRWWSHEPVVASRPVEFISDKDYLESKDDFKRTDIIAPISGPIFQASARSLILHLAPPEAQWLPAVIKTSRGELIEGWWMLHIWKLWDCWDRERSQQARNDKETFDYLQVLHLDLAKVIAVPEEERLIIRLEVFDDEYILFHERLVDILLKNTVKGALFVPLNLFSPGASWWHNNKEEINRLHPW